MFCRNCGKVLDEGAAFCGSCGSRVEQAAGPTGPEAAVTVPLQPVPPVPEAPIPQATIPLPPAQSAYPAYPPTAAAPPYAQPYGAPAEAPVAPASKTPLLIGVGVLVAVAVAALVLWQTGVLPGWLNGGSKTPTSTVNVGVTTSTTGGPAVIDETTTPLPPPDEPPSTALPDSESYDALVNEWGTIVSLRAEFGEKFPGESKGSGWIYDTWSRRIGAKSSRADRVDLAAEATDWARRIDAEADRFAALEMSSAYSSSQDDLMGILAYLSERAHVYSATSEYAVDNPTISKNNEPWRAVQDGQLGGNRAASDVLKDLQDAAEAYVPPDAP